MALPRALFRPGEWLVESERDGIYRFASDVVFDWDGALVGDNEIDGKHPQLNFRTINYNTQPRFTQVQTPVSAVSLTLPATIGETSVPRPRSPADHLFD